MLDMVLTPQHYLFTFVPIQTVRRGSAAKNNSARSINPLATCTQATRPMSGVLGFYSQTVNRKPLHKYQKAIF